MLLVKESRRWVLIVIINIYEATKLRCDHFPCDFCKYICIIYGVRNARPPLLRWFSLQYTFVVFGTWSTIILVIFAWRFIRYTIFHNFGTFLSPADTHFPQFWYLFEPGTHHEWCICWKRFNRAHVTPVFGHLIFKVFFWVMTPFWGLWFEGRGLGVISRWNSNSFDLWKLGNGFLQKLSLNMPTLHQTATELRILSIFPLLMDPGKIGF